MLRPQEDFGAVADTRPLPRGNMLQAFGIAEALMTTVHATTGKWKLLIIPCMTRFGTVSLLNWKTLHGS
ncbi:hypothetical protein V6N11_064492 [Hibiscus sabdariffa]|uniref:Uncharacterized protein n=1 Tax=Hibiscus sabdariffa TaxID=183260 RepID=A0ABR1ZFP2_9ROSI